MPACATGRRSPCVHGDDWERGPCAEGQPPACCGQAPASLQGGSFHWVMEPSPRPPSPLGLSRPRAPDKHELSYIPGLALTGSLLREHPSRPQYPDPYMAVSLPLPHPAFLFQGQKTRTPLSPHLISTWKSAFVQLAKWL